VTARGPVVSTLSMWPGDPRHGLGHRANDPAPNTSVWSVMCTMYDDRFWQTIGSVVPMQTEPRVRGGAIVSEPLSPWRGEPDLALASAVAFLMGNDVFELPEAASARGYSERRLSLLYELASASPSTSSREAACSIVADILSRHTAEVPFARVYLFDVDGHAAWLACATGLQSGGMGLEAHHVEAETVTLLEQVRASGETVSLNDAASGIGLRFGRHGLQPHRRGLVVPLRAAPGRTAPFGALVVGTGPRQRIDAAYHMFSDLLAHHVGSVFARALAQPAAAERDLAIVKLQDDALQMFFGIGLVASAALADPPSESAADALSKVAALARIGTDSLREAASALTRREL
jgi:hypothetical protein